MAPGNTDDIKGIDVQKQKWHEIIRATFANARNREQDADHVVDVNVAQSSNLDAFGENRICVVCMENPATVKIIPCEHVVVCTECVDEVVKHVPKCPVCRAEVEELLNIRSGSIHSMDLDLDFIKSMTSDYNNRLDFGLLFGNQISDIEEMRAENRRRAELLYADMRRNCNVLLFQIFTSLLLALLGAPVAVALSGKLIESKSDVTVAYKQAIKDAIRITLTSFGAALSLVLLPFLFVACILFFAYFFGPPERRSRIMTTSSMVVSMFVCIWTVPMYAVAAVSNAPVNKIYIGFAAGIAVSLTQHLFTCCTFYGDWNKEEVKNPRRLRAKYYLGTRLCQVVISIAIVGALKINDPTGTLYGVASLCGLSGNMIVVMVLPILFPAAFQY